MTLAHELSDLRARMENLELLHLATELFLVPGNLSFLLW